MLRSLQKPTLRASRNLYTPLSVRLASTQAQAPGVSKVYKDVAEAVKDIKSGSIVLSSGFGLCGTPDTLIKAISENSKIRNLTCVSNNAGVGQKGLGEYERSFA
jgi:3-oxoacid CoA-transferase